MKRIFRKSKVLFVILVLASAVQAQQPLSKELLHNKKFGSFLHPESKEGWIEFREDAPYKATDIFTQQPELLGLRGDDEMRIFKVNTDVAGNQHVKYAQYYKGVRVEKIEHIVHDRKGKVFLMNGDFIRGIDIGVIPSVSIEHAVEVALVYVSAEKYLWEVPGQEEHFKKKKNDPNASLYPRPELLIVRADLKGGKVASNYVLAWRMAIFSAKPDRSEYVYVNAHSGRIIRSQSLIVNCSPGTAETTFNGTQTVYTNYTTYDCGWDQEEVTDYFTWDDCNPDTEIQSWYVDDGILGGDYFYCDDNNNWNSGIGSIKMTITSLWGARKAYDYYNNTWGHQSFDGSDGLIDVYSNRIFTDDDGEDYCGNARYVNIIDNIEFGAGYDCSPGNGDDYNTIDIIGHEYTHGVVEYAHTDALDYSDESGALNESFADIFGEAVERYVEGDNDWWNGFDRTDDTGDPWPIRCYSRPDTGSLNDPDTYLADPYWYTGNDDNGGVHTNSGVQNHMFYLLCEGGSGTNDLGWNYNVTGIGFSDGISIAFQAMMNYLDGDDGYVTARNAWIQSAKDLFGSCSQEVISTGEAWMAAGVTHYTTYNLASFCGTYSTSAFIDAAQEIRNASILFSEFFTDCTTTINSPAAVTVESGNIVSLHPGFTALSGSVFTALIDKCEQSDYDANDLRAESGFEVTADLREKKSFVRAYPNPANDNVKLSLNGIDNKNVIGITLINSLGQVLKEQDWNTDAEDQQLDVSQINAGMFIIIVKTTAEQFTLPLVIE